MARLTERVRCIVCTHYPTEYRTDGCSHTACPHRKHLSASPSDQLHQAHRLYEEIGLTPIRRHVAELFDSYAQDNDDKRFAKGNP